MHPKFKTNVFFLLSSQDFLEKNTEEFQLYKEHSDHYICSLIPGSPSFQAQYTPGYQLLSQK